jgi:predicted DNA-binding protein with PD1-like motif
MTTPARTEDFCPGEKLSATPRALIPGLFVCKGIFSPLVRWAPEPFNLGLPSTSVAVLRKLDAGALIPDAILQIAAKEKIRTATFQAIGGVDRLTLGYYNRLARRYEEHSYRGFMEVTSLIGNVAEKEGEPFVHAHGTFGRRDMSVIGGHVIRATVFPTLEFTLVPTTNRAIRKFDERTGLNLIEGFR